MLTAGAFTGYFRGQKVSGIPEIVVPVYERTTPAPEEPLSTTFSSSQAAPAIPNPSKPAVRSSLRLPRATLRYHARLSLLLVSLAVCLLYATLISLPALPLKSRISFHH